MRRIQFGTDGWRGRIADDFTVERLRQVAQATATVLSRNGSGGRVILGHDLRFLAEQHARHVAEVLAGNGLEVLQAAEAVPTPAVSSLVIDHAAIAGVMLTASHNPPEYSGFKLKTATGGSAPPDLTRAIEDEIGRQEVRRCSLSRATGAGLWREVPFREEYFRRLRGRVDDTVLQRSRPLHIVMDVMHGSAGSLLEDFLAGTPHRVETLRTERHVLFGGQSPEPTPERLGGLRQAVMQRGADIGLATDGDGDRVAAVDEGGRFLTAHQISPLLADYLVRVRGERGMLARTCANTVLIDRIAAAHSLPSRVLPIGFKHLVPLLESGELLLGGEESGGIGVAGYLPERDGTLLSLLVVEMCAASGRPLSALVRELWQRHGEMHYARRDLPVAAPEAARHVQDLATTPPAALAGLPVTGTDALDGIKLLLGEAGWVMARASGTEPVLRLYCEATSERTVVRVLDAIQERLAES